MRLARRRTVLSIRRGMPVKVRFTPLLRLERFQIWGSRWRKGKSRSSAARRMTRFMGACDGPGFGLSSRLGVGYGSRLGLILSVLLGLTAAVAHAQEPPYFVTYSHVLEEPGNLEIASQNVGATPKNANPSYSQTVELEYGVTAWYTAEVYLQGQSTVHDSTIFTGFRFRESVPAACAASTGSTRCFMSSTKTSTQADKSFLEITGNHVISDQAIANGVLRKDVERSVEGKLILSSNFNGFNISENIIAEKNVSNEPWEFGYAVGAGHSLSSHGQRDGLPVLPAVLCRGRRAVRRAWYSVRLRVQEHIDLCRADDCLQLARITTRLRPDRSLG